MKEYPESDRQPSGGCFLNPWDEFLTVFNGVVVGIKAADEHAFNAKQ